MACATASGGAQAVLRVAGSQLRDCVLAIAGAVPQPWTLSPCRWQGIPVRLLWCPGPRSFTGDDLLEITVPGSPALIDLACERLRALGGSLAPPGYFARRALSNGRLRLDQAEALLALVHAQDAPAAQRAIAWLRGSLGAEVQTMRDTLLHLRALVEAGLDFMDEADVRAYEEQWLRDQLQDVDQRLQRWLRAAQRQDGAPLVVLAGPANAGKSALFNALTGSRALVSDQAGTTRDWLDAPWQVGDRQLRLLDTAGWLDAEQGLADLDQRAIQRGRDLLEAAAVVLWCTAPDASLPTVLPATTVPTLTVATKVDRADSRDPRASLGCSAHSGAGLAALGEAVVQLLADDGGLPARQYHALRAAQDCCQRVLAGPLPGDELLAHDLSQAARHLQELLGEVSSDDILGAIFSQFCIGK